MTSIETSSRQIWSWTNDLDHLTWHAVSLMLRVAILWTLIKESWPNMMNDNEKKSVTMIVTNNNNSERERERNNRRSLDFNPFFRTPKAVVWRLYSSCQKKRFREQHSIRNLNTRPQHFPNMEQLTFFERAESNSLTRIWKINHVSQMRLRNRVLWSWCDRFARLIFESIRDSRYSRKPRMEWVNVVYINLMSPRIV